MKSIILSFNDYFFGPKIVLNISSESQREDLEQIPSIMNLYELGFFTHSFAAFKTINFMFEIPSNYSRVDKERLLLSIIIGKKERVNTELTQELLQTFAEEIININDAYKAFYINSKTREGSPEILDKIKELLQSFYKSFPEKDIIFEQKEAKILIFGLSFAGKTTIIRNCRKSISKTIFPTMALDLSRILVNNVSLLAYDTPGQSKFKELWKPYLKGQDGLVFVLDVTDKIKFPDAKGLLHEIANKPELKNLPLCILFNKVDVFKPDIDKLINEMDISAFKDRPVKYFTTSGIRNINIDEAFNWLALQISERVQTIPKSKIGIIFARWDENIGVKTLAVYPEDAFDDHELIAVRCFSISQFLFGGGEFKRTSFILPFPHLNAIAAVYFDFIEDKSVRGGLLPLCLIIFYNEIIPRVLMDQFNTFIFNKISEFKAFYENKDIIFSKIKDLNSMMISQIESFQPTMQALRIAELKYEALFKGARDAILIIDQKSGIIIEANKQAEVLYQLPFEDFIGLHSSQLLTDDMKTDFKEVIFKQVENEGNPPIELNIINTAGDVIPVEINLNKVQMGNEILIQCIIRNILARKSAENNLKESEKKYRNLFENSPFPIILIDPKGMVENCNPAMEKVLGYSREELVKKRFVDLSIVHDEYLVPLLSRFREFDPDKILPSMEIQLYKKDGSLIWANIQSSLIKMGYTTYYQIIGEDITEKKKAEQALKEALKNLKNSEIQLHQEYDRTNFYKELFAHDVNDILSNIISTINNFSTLIPEAKLHDMETLLEDIKIQCETGDDLINIVKKLTQIEEFKGLKFKLNLYDKIEVAIDEIGRKFPDKEINILIESPTKELYVNGNDFVSEIFVNILSSSIIHNENPKIEIKIIIFRNQREDKFYFKIEFVDYKKDIRQIRKERFLHREERREGKSRGILLGLTLVERILDTIEGQIWVEGDNFVILIPEI